MERQYKDLCKRYGYKPKVYIKPSSGLKNKVGSPDLTICFTSCLSHKLLHSAMSELKRADTIIEHSKSASVCALREILERHSKASA